MFKRFTMFARIGVVASLLFVSAQFLVVSASTSLPRADKCRTAPTQSATQSATQVATAVATAVSTGAAEAETPEANNSDNGQVNDFEDCKTPKATSASNQEVEMTEVAEPTDKPEPTHTPDATHKPEATEKLEETQKAEDKQGHDDQHGSEGGSGGHD